MALSPSSRYSVVSDDDGIAVTKLKGRDVTRFLTVISYGGQTFQELAATYLGDPKLFWRIADMNPHVPYPDEIPMGTSIRIPEI